MNHLAKASRSVVEYLQGAYREFLQVTWPSRETMIQYTVLVLVSIVAITAFLTAFNFGMQKLVDIYLIR